MPRPRAASILVSSAVGVALAACGSVLGLDDIDYESAADASPDARPSLDGSVDGSPEGSPGDAGGGGSVHDVSVRFDAPTVIATGTTPQALAVDETRVYWIDDELGGASGASVLSIAKDGTGPVATIATGQPSPTDIAVDDDAVYWSVSSPPPVGDGATSCLAMMASKAPDAGPPVCVTMSAEETARMTINETGVVILVNALPSQFIGYAPKQAGSTFLSKVTQGAAQAIAATSATAFVGNVNGPHVDGFSLSSLQFGAGVCTTNCGNAPAIDMVVDTSSANVIWVTSNNQVYTAPAVPTSADGTLLASLPKPSQRIARDGSYVYVTAPAGFVYAVPLYGADAGAPFLVIASAQHSPYGVAVDTNNVYWSNGGDGTISAVGVPPAP